MEVHSVKGRRQELAETTTAYLTGLDPTEAFETLGHELQMPDLLEKEVSGTVFKPIADSLRERDENGRFETIGEVLGAYGFSGSTAGYVALIIGRPSTSVRMTGGEIAAKFRIGVLGMGQ